MRTSERQYWRVAQVTTFGGGLFALCVVFAVVLVLLEEGRHFLKALVLGEHRL